MLNISKTVIGDKIPLAKYRSHKLVLKSKFSRVLTYWLYGFFGVFTVILFVPWTQNIQSKGKLTTLYPSQRPQTIQSTIDGRIEKWYVREGDYVNEGDTIVHISEIKDAYFDPALLDRTEQQITAKAAAVESYKSKVLALDRQIAALKQTRSFKLEQATNKIAQAVLKVTADSIDYQAALVSFEIGKDQLKRQEELYKDGLKSLTELEKRRNNFQKVQAKLISQESKLLVSRSELINSRLNYSTILNEFADKLSKAESDQYSALSNQFDSEATLTKLRNQLTNYEMRAGFRFIQAPQSGFVTKTIQAGIGETIKQGAKIVSVVKLNVDMAVELYVEPVDLPLIRLGQKARIEFDGWPAVVFSGWPNLSFGTFGAEVVAIDNMISKNNKYRILVAHDKNDEPWPDLIRVGSGAKGFALLQDVPIWYELWRQLNGFPPDFYIDLDHAGDQMHNRGEDQKENSTDKK